MAVVLLNIQPVIHFRIIRVGDTWISILEVLYLVQELIPKRE